MSTKCRRGDIPAEGFDIDIAQSEWWWGTEELRGEKGRCGWRTSHPDGKLRVNYRFQNTLLELKMP
jgi:hypothetical protein